MRIAEICLISSCTCVAIASLAYGDVTGTIKLAGKAPEPRQIDMSGVKECADQHPDPVYDETVVVGQNGELANVVVSVKTDDPSSLGGEIPKEPAVLDQKACTYVPHVLAMMAGQELIIKNDDPFLHNVHSLAQINPAFNFAQPNRDPGKKIDSPKVAENIKVKCDVHPWMSAWIVVLEHPFFSVSTEDGTFRIRGLPDGQYTLQAWHEKFGAQEQTIEVKDGKAEVNFTFTAGTAQGNDADPPKFASIGTGQICEQCPDKPCNPNNKLAEK